MSEYHINLFWRGEDECWIADIPDLKFCSAHGETPDEALREVMIAKKAWLASAQTTRSKAALSPGDLRLTDQQVWADGYLRSSCKATSPWPSPSIGAGRN